MGNIREISRSVRICNVYKNCKTVCCWFSMLHGETPESSCVSVKSDWSMENPPKFSGTDSPVDVR